MSRRSGPDSFGVKAVSLAIALLLSSPLLHAVELDGVSVSPSATVHGIPLILNGVGLRTFRLLMVPIKVYVAALYTPVPLRSVPAVESSSGPMQFDFTFLRAVGQSDVTKAWGSQFDHSISFTYPGYQKDRDAFIGMFGALPQGGVEQVSFVGANTVVSDCGTVRGSVAGRNFQQAFLSLWFGPKPVSHSLRDRLLGVMPPG